MRRFDLFRPVDQPSHDSRVDAVEFFAGLLDRPDRPTAIFASDSVIALQVFKAVRSMMLSIPGDVSLVSFHDADWTSVTTPPITVVSQPVYDLGREAARMLIRRIQGTAEAPERRVLKTTLIARASICPPAKDRVE